MIRNKKEVETSIFDLRQKILEIDKKLKRSYQDTQKVLFGVMVSSLDKNENSVGILSKNLLKKMLSKKIVKLKKQMLLQNQLQKAR